MRLLLDTHALLWFALGDGRLSAVARQQIAAPDNQVLVSPASYWEIAIKISLGKYVLNEPYRAFMYEAIQGNGFEILPILPEHTGVLTTLPFHHRDPFDRLLIGQAIAELVPLVSGDASLDRYPVTRIW
ncbi:MAG: type II toxin-antitoxin system VapC family toxin [Armatimonadota bacterium]